MPAKNPGGRHEQSMCWDMCDCTCTYQRMHKIICTSKISHMQGV